MRTIRVLFVVLVSIAAFMPSPDVSALPEQPPQTIPTNVMRVGGHLSPTADIDGVDEHVDVDIALLDSGVPDNHPDLNVVRRHNCTDTKGSGDKSGFGTRTAGTMAALDNEVGYVGIAPGARIWSIRIGARRGGRESWMRCGINFVTKHADEIDVAIVTAHGPVGNVPDDGDCGMTIRDRTHQAICRSVEAGVTWIANAGNYPRDVALEFPGNYDEVITVSGFADSDGIPGGLGPQVECLAGDEDDTFADGSNYGQDIDISVPGLCHQTTTSDKGYALTGGGVHVGSGFVAGAAGLYKANHPEATPAEVKAALLAAAEPGPIEGDPDAFPEPILNVSTF